MKMIISPAKRIELQKGAAPIYSEPVFKKEAYLLANTLKEYSPWQLEPLLKTSTALAVDAFVMHQDFTEDKMGRAALLSYNGLVFQHIDVHSFSADDFSFANERLYILSALYGALAPADVILPYRLDFLSKLKINEKSLYLFWGNKVYKEVYKENDVVINLASEEYAKLIRPYIKQNNTLVDMVFYTMKKGKRTIITTTAKAARGEMVQYIVKNRLQDLKALQLFNWNGFVFEKETSTENRFVFLQKQ